MGYFINIYLGKESLITTSFNSECPVCKKIRTYKTKLGFKNGITKPCRSCSNSISRGGTGSKVSADGIKCSKCEKYLPETDFYFKKGDNIPYSYCKKCHNSAGSKYYKEKDKFNRYGITKDDYEALLKNQENKCTGCKLELTDPHIDHCHQTGKVRGILCHPCNTSLGLLKENIDTLQNLINYLKGNNNG